MSQESVLQQRAAVVREQQAAIEQDRENLKVAEADYQEKWLAFQESEYNLFTTKTLLSARETAQEFNLQKLEEFVASNRRTF